MVSIKRALIIDSDQFATSLPQVGEKVRIVGQEDEFLVLNIDRARHTADLMCTSGTKRVEQGVLLRALRRVHDVPAQNSNRLDRFPKLQVQE